MTGSLVFDSITMSMELFVICLESNNMACVGNTRNGLMKVTFLTRLTEIIHCHQDMKSLLG
jgi:hypothetical protein